MMNLSFRNRDGSRLDPKWAHEWDKLAKSDNIDLAKFISFFLMIANLDDKEAKEAFNACMYMMSVFLNSEGSIIFTTGNIDELEASNIELAAELAPTVDDPFHYNGMDCEPEIKES